MGFFKIGSLNYLPELASNHDSPDLCLLSSWDYRREARMPGFTLILYLLSSYNCSRNQITSK
jgi:hypothetical protein